MDNRFKTNKSSNFKQIISEKKRIKRKFYNAIKIATDKLLRYYKVKLLI